MAGEAILPDNFAVQGLPSEADLVAAFAATPGYQAMAKAEADKQARIAAYKAANPGASDFAARYYGGTDEDRARIAAMYPGTFGKLHKSMYYSGAAPQEGQSILDYMLANNGQMPDTKVKEGPGLGQALLNAAMLAAAGFGVGTLGNALAAGAAGAGAGAGAGTAAGTAAGGTGAAGTGAAGAGAAGAGAAGGLGATTTIAGLGAAAVPTVSELVITAATAGMTVPQIAAAAGISTAAVNSILQGSSGSGTLQGGDTTAGQPTDTVGGTGGFEVDPLVIQAAEKGAVNPAIVAPVVGAGALGLSALDKPLTMGDYTQVGGDYKPVDQIDSADLTPKGGSSAGVGTIDPTQLASGVEKGVGYTPPTAADLMSGGTPNLAQKALDWVKANPIDAARLGLTLVGGGAAVASDGGTGGGGIPPGFAAAGTPGSLSDIFRAKLPAPSGPFADLSARNVAMTPEQWKTYGQRSEQSFFNNAPQRPSGILDTSRRAPPMPAPSAEPEKFAKGGFAVRGIGSGRDDKIPARLSDGEYVMDAETVALLGDGSSDAGAKRLDAFRANIRKHKGKKLARGEFSVNAKKPEAYLKGGRA